MTASTKRQQRQIIIDELAGLGIEAMYGKGGFWLRGNDERPTRHISFAKARKMTAVEVPDNLKRQHCERVVWGDMAIVAMLNGIK